jgi:membrane glycosyltransferase
VTFQARQSDILRASVTSTALRRRTAVPAARRVFFALTTGMTCAVSFGVAYFVADWTFLSVLAMALVVPSLLWISGGAATSLIGLFCSRPASSKSIENWQPAGQTAVLMMLCGEDPYKVAQSLSELSRQIGKAALTGHTRLIVLSDTFGQDAIAAEEAAFAPLIANEMISYRRRNENTGRKPGNIAEWFDREGRAYAQMLVLDADSRMSGARLARMIWRMESQPGSWSVAGRNGPCSGTKPLWAGTTHRVAIAWATVFSRACGMDGRYGKLLGP